MEHGAVVLFGGSKFNMNNNVLLFRHTERIWSIYREDSAMSENIGIEMKGQILNYMVEFLERSNPVFSNGMFVLMLLMIVPVFFGSWAKIVV